MYIVQYFKVKNDNVWKFDSKGTKSAICQSFMCQISTVLKTEQYNFLHSQKLKKIQKHKMTCSEITQNITIRQIAANSRRSK